MGRNKEVSMLLRCFVNVVLVASVGRRGVGRGKGEFASAPLPGETRRAHQVR